VDLVILIKFFKVYLACQTHFIIVFDLTSKQKCIKHYKQLKYNLEMRMKHQINLTKFD